MKITKQLVILLFTTILLQGQPLRAQQPDSTAIDSLTYNIFKALPEVMVKGERPVVKAKKGMLEYDMPRLISKLPVSNVYEALKQLPGVVEMNDNLSLNGQGMTIILNGKVSTMTTEQLYTLLKSMPSSRIEKAEVMYAAPARYEVRGAAINLILKSELDKPANAQGELFSEWKQKHFGTFTERGSLLFSSKKLSADLLYSYNQGRELFLEDKTSIHTLNDGSVYHLNIDNRQVNRSHRNNARLGMDYAFGKEHLLSFVYTAQWNNDNNRNNSTGDEISSSTHHSNSALHNFQLDYKLPFHLKIGAEYTHYNNPGNQTVNSLLNNEQINLYSRDRQRINKLKLSVGQEWSLPKDWTMNVGAYYISSNDHSFQHYYDVTTDTLLTGSSMSSVHREKMLNIYGGFSKSFGSKLSAEASLAAEYYHSDVWNEWNFFPTLSISYMPADGHTLQASLSSDRTYPSFWSVQNTTSHISAYTEIQGNPSLKPSSNYQGQLTYIFKNKYILTLYYDYDKDYIAQTCYQARNRLAEIFKFFNFNYHKQSGIQLSFPVSITDRMNNQITLIGFHDQQKCDNFWDIRFDRKLYSYMAVLNSTLTISKKPDIRFTLYGFYQHGMLQGIYNLPHSGQLDASLRWTSNNKKFEVTAKGGDLFNTSSISPYMDSYSQYVKHNYWACQRTFVLSFSYKFGNYKEKQHGNVDTSRFK